MYARLKEPRKLLQGALEQTIRDGGARTRAYLERSGSGDGHLVVFDRTADKP